MNDMDCLKELESEAVYIIREAYSQFDKCGILFSGGKDSIVLTWLAKKAFYPLSVPFPLVHIDTGHNFEETIAFRDEFAKRMNVELIVGDVYKNILDGTAKEEGGEFPSRNRAQSVTLMDVIKEYKFDAVFGGGRRDEEKARAKERVFSHRNSKGAWTPENQRPELWSLYSGLKNNDEHFRIFPISNWTELDIWNYILKENIPLPSLYFSHERKCVQKGNSLLAYSEFLNLSNNHTIDLKTVRFRTIGDMTISGAIESKASSVEEIIQELQDSDLSERGYRMDDMKSDAAMEERKKEGYF